MEETHEANKKPLEGNTNNNEKMLIRSVKEIHNTESRRKVKQVEFVFFRPCPLLIHKSHTFYCFYYCVARKAPTSRRHCKCVKAIREKDENFEVTERARSSGTILQRLQSLRSTDSVGEISHGTDVGDKADLSAKG